MNIAAQPAGSQCPVTHDFDPFSASYLADPYPLYNRLRQETPVVFSPEYNVYLVNRFDLSVQIMNDRETFSSSNTQIPFTPIQPEAAKNSRWRFSPQTDVLELRRAAASQDALCSVALSQASALGSRAAVRE